MALGRTRNAALGLFSGLGLMAALVYVGGLSGVLQPAAHLVWFAGQALFLFWLVRGVRGKGLFRAFLTSPGPWVYAGLCLVHWLLFQNAELWSWDEFSHWALAPKEMFYSHALYGPGGNLSHGHYPPGAALLHYMNALHAGFSSGVLYNSQFMLLLAPFMALLQGLQWRWNRWQELGRGLGWCVLAIALTVLLLADLGQGVALLLVDALLGAWFGGVLLFYLGSRRSGAELLLLAPPLFLLVLFKELGLFFAFAALGLILASQWLRRGSEASPEEKGRGVVRRRALVFGVLLLCPLLAHFSWKAHLSGPETVSRADRTNREVGKASLPSRAWDFFVLGKAAPHQELVLRRFGEVVLHQQQARSELDTQLNEFNYSFLSEYTADWRMSAVGWAALCLALVLLRALLAREKGKRRELLLWTFWLGGVFAVYMFMLLCLYLFIFKEGGAQQLVSYTRYANIMLLPLAMTALGAYFPLYGEPQQEGQAADRRAWVVSGLAIILTAGLYVAEPPYPEPMYKAKELDFFRRDMAPVLKQVRENLGSKDRLYIVFPVKSNGLFRVIMKYELSPIRTTVSPPGILDGPRARLERGMAGNDYVLLLLPRKSWAEGLRRYLPPGALRSLLYRVVLTPDGLKLRPVLPEKPVTPTRP